MATNKNKPSNNKEGKGFKPSMKGKQGRKDNRSRRVNYDNTRETKFEKDIEEGSCKPSANAISHLSRNAELMKAAASLPFATILGNPYGDNTVKSTVPGIMRVALNPSWGTGAQPIALNKAFQLMGSYLVSANSRTPSWDYPDLGIMVFAGMEVFVALASAKRVYGTAKYYPEQNRYTADALITAMGFDPQDIRDNLGQMWFDINNLIMQTKQIWIPNTMPILDRWMEQVTSVYTDAPGMRSQLYLYVRNRYFKFSATESTTGSCLVPATVQPAGEEDPVAYELVKTLPVPETPSYTPVVYKWSQFKQMIQDMIDALVLDSDRMTIYGDILKAYGADKIFALKDFTPDYTVIPEYNAEISMQIENVTVSRSYPVYLAQTVNKVALVPLWGTPSPDTSASVIQTIKWGAPRTQILNMHIANQPTPEAVMVATRLKSGACTKSSVYTFKQNTDGTITPGSQVSQWIPSTTGSEIAAEVTMYMWNGSVLQAMPVDMYNQMNEGVNFTVPSTWPRLMAFDWHPFMYRVNPYMNTMNAYLNGMPATTMFEAYGDFDNFIILNDVELAKLHDTALYSLLGIPLL